MILSHFQRFYKTCPNRLFFEEAADIAVNQIPDDGEVDPALLNRFRELNDSVIEVDSFIQGVQRSDIKGLLFYRFKQGLTWKAASRKVYGRLCEDRARKAVKRYLVREGRKNHYERNPYSGN